MKGLLTRIIKENKRIIFNGNNYADEWQKDAGKRGLLNHRTSVDAFEEILSKENIAAFEKYGVLKERELRARHEVALEQYNKTINIEAQLMVLMANRYILPAAYRFQGELATSVTAVKSAGGAAKETKKTLDKVTKLIDEGEGGRRSPPGPARPRSRRRSGEARQVLPRQGHPRDDVAAGGGRRARVPRPAESVAAADLSRDVVHQVGRQFPVASFQPGRLRAPRLFLPPSSPTAICYMYFQLRGLPSAIHSIA